MTITTDLSDFGDREFAIAANLMMAYSKIRGTDEDFLSDKVQVFLNQNSGYVFLSDEDFNVAMVNGGKLEQFHSCPECGCEGFADDLVTDHKIGNANDCCIEYLREIGAIESEDA